MVAEQGDGSRDGDSSRGDGTAHVGGIELHALAMVVAADHVLNGMKVRWLDKVEMAFRLPNAPGVTLCG